MKMIVKLLPSLFFTSAGKMSLKYESLNYVFAECQMRYCFRESEFGQVHM